MDEYMEKLVNSKEFELFKNLDKATLKIVDTFLLNYINVFKI